MKFEEMLGTLDSLGEFKPVFADTDVSGDNMLFTYTTPRHTYTFCFVKSINHGADCTVKMVSDIAVCFDWQDGHPTVLSNDIVEVDDVETFRERLIKLMRKAIDIDKEIIEHGIKEIDI